MTVGSWANVSPTERSMTKRNMYIEDVGNGGPNEVRSLKKSIARDAALSNHLESFFDRYRGAEASRGTSPPNEDLATRTTDADLESGAVDTRATAASAREVLSIPEAKLNGKKLRKKSYQL